MSPAAKRLWGLVAGFVGLTWFDAFAYVQLGGGGAWFTATLVTGYVVLTAGCIYVVMEQ